jgi:hypothetical protein
MARPRHQVGAEPQQQNGRWVSQFWVYRKNEGGREVRHHRTVTLGDVRHMTKTEAKAALQKLVAKEAPTRKDGKLTLSEYADQWLSLKAAKWRDSTLQTNRQIVNSHILKSPLADRPLESITTDDLQILLNELARRNYSYSVVQHVASFLRQIFAKASWDGRIARNEASVLEIPRIDRYTVRQWRDEEIRTLRSRQKPYLEVDQIRILLGMCGQA